MDHRAHYYAWSEMPVEVFEAIDGKTEALVELLRSEVPLKNATREALALWLEGELKPKLPRGRPKALRQYGDIPSQVWINFAEKRYRRIAKRLERWGRLRGNADKLLAAIAKKDGVHEEALRNAVRAGPRTEPPIASDLREQFLVWKAQNK